MANNENDIEMLQAEVIKLKAENSNLVKTVANIEKNLIKQIEMYNQHIANLHVRPI